MNCPVDRVGRFAGLLLPRAVHFSEISRLASERPENSLPLRQFRSPILRFTGNLSKSAAKRRQQTGKPTSGGTTQEPDEQAFIFYFDLMNIDVYKD